MGDTATKSAALKFPHIKFLDEQFTASYRTAPTRALQHEAAAAGTANLLFWLGWVRSNEGFALLKEDVTITTPNQGPRKGLPLGVGVVEIRLLPETKTNSARVADIIVAYTCFSGLSLGTWMERLFFFEPMDGTTLFSTPAQRTWNSRYYRSQHVYRHLEILRIQGDPSMATYSDAPGHRISDLMFSMHSWRRGADTFVQQFHPGIQKRKARKPEIYEHARWALRHTTEDMHVHYREWDIVERTCLTQLAM
jgi:hypothetical protein